MLFNFLYIGMYFHAFSLWLVRFIDSPKYRVEGTALGTRPELQDFLLLTWGRSEEEGPGSKPIPAEI